MTQPTPPSDRPLDYDKRAATLMLASLIGCPPAKRLDTLAVVVKGFVEGALDTLPATPFPRRESP